MKRDAIIVGGVVAIDKEEWENQNVVTDTKLFVASYTKYDVAYIEKWN